MTDGYPDPPPGEIRISDHAIKRYIERVEQVPLEVAAKRIEAYKTTILRAKAFGCTSVIITGGYRLCLKGATVTTIKESKQKPLSLNVRKQIARQARRARRVQRESEDGR